MTIPGIIFSLFIALLLGSLMHLWRGGSLFRLTLYLILSIIGFFASHFVANLLSIHFWKVGSINLGFGILGSIILLGLGHWLSPEEKRK